jgi:hypothetical protein
MRLLLAIAGMLVAVLVAGSIGFSVVSIAFAYSVPVQQRFRLVTRHDNGDAGAWYFPMTQASCQVFESQAGKRFCVPELQFQTSSRGTSN